MIKLIFHVSYYFKTRKDFANGSSANVNFSKTQLPNMIQLGGILGELLVVPYKVLKQERKNQQKEHQN